MTRYTVSRAAAIHAPASDLYHILADYTEGHPAILPTRYFRRLTVEQGGIGEGAVIRVEVNLPGRVRILRAVVTEPMPGRALVETDLDSGTTTTFAVEPVAGERLARVSISTELVPRVGPVGRLEGWLASVFLRRVIDAELEQLAEYARQRARLRERRRARAGVGHFEQFAGTRAVHCRSLGERVEDGSCPAAEIPTSGSRTGTTVEAPAAARGVRSGRVGALGRPWPDEPVPLVTG